MSFKPLGSAAALVFFCLTLTACLRSEEDSQTKSTESDSPDVSVGQSTADVDLPAQDPETSTDTAPDVSSDIPSDFSPDVAPDISGGSVSDRGESADTSSNETSDNVEPAIVEEQVVSEEPSLPADQTEIDVPSEPEEQPEEYVESTESDEPLDSDEVDGVVEQEGVLEEETTEPESVEIVRASVSESSEQALQRIVEESPLGFSAQTQVNEKVIFGGPLSVELSGDRDFDEVADLWIQENGAALGVPGIELVLKQKIPVKNNSVWSYQYQQYIDAIPVEKSSVQIHVERVQGKARVTYAFSRVAVPLAAGFSAVESSEQEALSLAQALPEFLGFNEWSLPKLAVYFDPREDTSNDPILSWKLEAKQKSASGDLKKYSILFIDVNTGELIHAENQFHDVNVSGNLVGNVTPGVLPDTAANPVEEVPLELLRMRINGTADLDDSDTNGDYAILNADALPQDLVSGMAGQSGLSGPQVQVVDSAGATFAITQAISINNEVLDFVFNSSPTEYSTAQMNAFYSTNLAYNFVVSRNAGFAGGIAQLDAIVNLNDDPCNAVYVANTSMRFQRATSVCQNSAYSTIIAHEYGHHLVNERGLAQAAFGEGVGDVLAMYLYDTPGVGLDFLLDDEYLRTPAISEVQYPCSGEIHFCGEVLGGIFWKIRDAIGLTAAQELFVDWLAVTAGVTAPNSASPLTAIEVLNIDDDDANLENGTPNQDAICTAFEAHSISCPIFLTFTFNAIPKVITPGSATTITTVVAGTALSNPQDSTGILVYRIDGGAWVQLVMTRTAANTYTVDLPALTEGQQIEFYFTAQTAAGSSISNPSGGAAAPFLAIAESPAPSSVLVGLPSSPVRMIGPELRTGATPASDRLFVLPEKSGSGLMNFSSTDLKTNSDLLSVKFPEGFDVSSRSLLYTRTEDSLQVLFTNDARTRVYYGSYANTAGKTAGTLSIDPKFCGEFQKISAIHFTEVAGAFSRMIVLDEGANKVYSYAINTSNSSLCTSEVSINIEKPLWVTSPDGSANIFIGSQYANQLRVGLYSGADLSVIVGPNIVANERDSHFGGVVFDEQTDQLVLGLAQTSDETNGDDHIRYYAADMSATATVSTCREPNQIEQDHANYIYVFCKSAKKVYLYDPNNLFSLLGVFEAGDRPMQMRVTQNGVNRFVSILQSNASVLLYRFAQASTTPVASSISSTLSLPNVMTEMGVFGADDELYLSSPISNQILFVDLTNQALSSTISLPQSIDSLAAQSASISHFVSKETDSVYSFQEISSNIWRLRTHLVGDYPIKVGYRANRLYVLNRNSNNLSIVNISGTPYATVSTLTTQTRPEDFSFDTTDDVLITANRTSQSFSLFNIDTTGPESLVGHVAIGFSPRKVLYSSGDNILYLAGGTSIAQYDLSDFTPITDITNPKTEVLTSTIKDIQPVTGGVLASSTLGLSLSLITPGAGPVVTSLTRAPEFIATNSTDVSVAALLQESQIYSGGNTYQLEPFDRLLDLTSHFAVFEPVSSRVRIFPFASVSSVAAASYIFDTNFLVPTVAADDGSSNFWFFDSISRRVLRVDSNFQAPGLQTRLINRPYEIVTWDAEDRVYMSLRNLGVVVAYDAANDTSIAYQVCGDPTDLAIDTDESKLFVLCRASDAVGVVSLDANGDPSGLSIISTQLGATDIKVNADRLFVVNKDSSTVSVYDTTDNSLVDTAVTRTGPRDLAVNSTNNVVTVVSESSEEITQFNGNSGAPIAETYTDVVFRALDRVSVNSTTGEVFALSRSSGGVYSSGIQYTGSTPVSFSAKPHELAVSEAEDKVYITYPRVDRIRIYDNSVSPEVVSELAVGDDPQALYVLDSASRVYISNRSGDSVSVINSATDALVTTVSLSSGCRPGKMDSLDVAGTVFLYILCENTDSFEVLDTSDNSLGTPLFLRPSN